MINYYCSLINYPISHCIVIGSYINTRAFPSHVTGFSDLVDMWVIQKKKPMILCARSTKIYPLQVNRAWNADLAARTCEKFFWHSIARLWLSNMADRFWGNSRGAQRYVGFFSLIVLFGCWLAGQTSSGHVVTLLCLYDIYGGWGEGGVLSLRGYTLAETLT